MAKVMKKEMTLLQAMERVVELSRDSKMSKELFRKAKDEIKLLAESYGITEQQAVLFCVCMEKGPCRVDYDDIANYLDLNKIKVFGYASDIDALVRRRLLKYRDVKDEEDFDVPTMVVRMLKHNEVYQLPRRKDLDCPELFEVLEGWFNDLKDDAVSPRELREEIITQVKRSKIAPILLFNEADGIIGIRQEGAQRAVEKMENSIQNIILQEMETLDGIMIATTNLQQNLDKAFERRFLYKVKFDKPTAEARACIWHEMIPDVDDSVINVLSEKYDFSGGQIENIARRYSIDTILHGGSENVLEMLSSHCDNERLDSSEHRKIGF